MITFDWNGLEFVDNIHRHVSKYENGPLTEAATGGVLRKRYL